MAGYADKFPMEKYYEKCVKPLDYKFGRRKSGKIVCPFHDDKAPSMGFILNKDGTEIYHCFGCHASGDVVKLHQGIEKEYHNRTISREQALRELCKMFGYSYEDLKEGERRETQSKIKAVQTMYLPREGMTLQTFEREWVKARRDRKPIETYNELLIQMIIANKEGDDGG